jgi:hypothetical protein
VRLAHTSRRQGGWGVKSCIRAHLSWVVLDVPVENAADEGRDERASELGGGNSLGHGEHESEVAGDTFLLKDLIAGG